MRSTRARLEANARYDAENTVQIHLKLNKKSDARLIEYLVKSGNKQGVLKAALEDFIDSGKYEKWADNFRRISDGCPSKP